MRAVLRFLGSRWFLSFVGVALLSVLVWLFGPFLEFLEGWIARTIVIAAMLLLWAGVNFWLDRRRRKRRGSESLRYFSGPRAFEFRPTSQIHGKLDLRLSDWRKSPICSQGCLAPRDRWMAMER